MTAYLAMGLRESNRAPGWYDEYVEQVYENANYDPEKTSERAKKNIRARLEEFAKDPAYTFQFFYEKMVSRDGMKPPLRPFGSAEPALMTKKTAPILAM